LKKVYILYGIGNSAIFNHRFKAMSKQAFSDKSLITEDIKNKFKQSCLDKDKGLDYALDD